MRSAGVLFLKTQRMLKRIHIYFQPCIIKERLSAIETVSERVTSLAKVKPQVKSPEAAALRAMMGLLYQGLKLIELGVPIICEKP